MVRNHEDVHQIDEQHEDAEKEPEPAQLATYRGLFFHDAASVRDDAAARLLAVRHPDIFYLRGMPKEFFALGLLGRKPITCFPVGNPGGF